MCLSLHSSRCLVFDDPDLGQKRGLIIAYNATKFSEQEQVTQISFIRPESCNAVSAGMATEPVKAAEEAGKPP